ncbi:hypothetical protein COLO4_13068 [Corchorus olitorius]|uniref:Uncharacterized protein n=1 Tax=Corchorus olitorius TaxID=93759 RepID=A0A1R3JYF2_9ROSI|nr:hypothetical protein COLO4_13068 [Corchorus olitorius]
MAGASLSQMCSKLSIQEEDKDKIVIDNEWIEDPEGVEEWFYLIGKLMLRKPAFAEGLWAVFQQAWRLSKGLVVREVGNDCSFSSFTINLIETSKPCFVLHRHGRTLSTSHPPCLVHSLPSLQSRRACLTFTGGSFSDVAS